MSCVAFSLNHVIEKPLKKIFKVTYVLTSNEKCLKILPLKSFIFFNLHFYFSEESMSGKNPNMVH